MAALDIKGQHAIGCMVGGARTTLHNALCRIVHRACTSAGLRSQREVVVPALATAQLTEPRIDIDAWGHPGLPHLRLDVTVVDPAAERYAKVRGQPAGPAQMAERGKAVKYGLPPGGVGVTGLALETTGRLGPNFAALLVQLAGFARAARAAAGQETTRELRHWHTQVSMCLARFTAGTLLSAQAAVFGKGSHQGSIHSDVRIG